MPALLVACFVVSGASGLLLEIVWTRELTQVFGSTTLAISTVLCAFMGGLALGSAAGGRLADRLGPRRVLLGYAACEVGIAVCAALLPGAILRLAPVNAWLWAHLEGWPGLLAGARFLLSALLLIVPTALMGATLPLLARHGEDVGGLGRRVGLLYAANTAGATLGAAATGFVFIAALGLRRTTLIAVFADLAVAVIALAMGRRAAARDPEVSLELAGPADAGPPPEPARPRLALLAFALSGAVAMALEVLWSRCLALVIGSSVYSFSLILIVFLAGLAVGAAALGRRAARSPAPLAALAWVFLGAGASAFLAGLVMDRLPVIFLTLIEGKNAEVGTVWAIQALLCATLMLPTTLCLGAVMPLAVRAYAREAATLGRDVGRAYAANTVGAIVGSFAGGFLLLPLLGGEWGMRTCALLQLGLAAACAAPRRRRGPLALAPVLAAAVLLAPRWDLTVLDAGVFRLSLARHFVRTGEIYRPELLFYEDGVSSTVAVEKHGQSLALKNNGKVEASTRADMPTQILVGLTPTVLHGGRGQRVALIGYGSGITVGAIAESPWVERVDVVEIEPAVLRAADRFFGDWNHHAERNPKVHRYLGDGRNFLAARAERYDVIVSEPSNPWIAGVASLFTRDFYARARGRLADGGVFCQWAQLYELGPRNVKMIYRTFHEAFPYVYAFSTADASADTILVGSLRPLDLGLGRLQAAWAEPALAAELARAGARSAMDLEAMLILAPDEIDSFTAGAEVNTDDSARLELSAPRDLVESSLGLRFADLIYDVEWPYGHLDGLVAPADGGEAAALAYALAAHGKRREAATWAAGARGQGGDPARAERLLGLARARDFDDSELGLTAGGPPLSTAADFDLLRGYFLYKLLDFDEAEKVLAALAGDEAFVARRPAVLYYLGRVLYANGAFSRGAEKLMRFADGWPQLAAPLG